MVSDKGRGMAQIALASLFWGASFPIIKYGMMVGVDTSWLVMLRFAVAAVLCCILLLRYGGLAMLGRSLFNRYFWLLGFFNGLAFVFQYHGLLYTTASKASLLINTNVIFVALFGVILFKERLSQRIVASIILALVGVFLLATEGDVRVLLRGEIIGDALEVMAALTWAFYILENKRLMDKGADALELTGGMMLGTLVFSAPYAIYRIHGGANLGVGQGMSILLPLGFVVLYTAIGGSIAAYFLYAKGVKHVSAVVSSVFLMFEMVAAVAISFVFLGERLGPIGFLGAVAVCFGIMIASSGEIKRRRKNGSLGVDHAYGG